ncbi:hypothetical protein [Hymenobacter crusticola]|uniref:hypothetical protein n=1 Tax=Hymenobacter crusticola TaxID=1770526 RepID=UPI0015C500D2|nr:hypothetical protein [Hymenobacter crusticola]
MTGLARYNTSITLATVNRYVRVGNVLLGKSNTWSGNRTTSVMLPSSKLGLAERS